MTNTGKYETDFGVVSLSTRELLGMPKDSRDFLIAASFVANDIRFHWSMMVRSPIDADEIDVKSMQMVRWLWCSRKLSSVIIEAVDTLDRFCGKISLLKEVARKITPVMTQENRQSGFNKVARVFRNKSAYHYSYNDAASELETFAENAPHRILAHKQSGNSISELAEQIFTIPTLKQIS